MVLSPTATVGYAGSDLGDVELDQIRFGGGGVFHIFVGDDASLDAGLLFL